MNGEVIQSPDPNEHKHPRPLYLINDDGSLKKVHVDKRRMPYLTACATYGNTNNLFRARNINRHYGWLE